MLLTFQQPHIRDLGGFTVRRLLPGHPHRLVGPFIFFDHLGPVDFAAGTGLDVRPHPHIGLATVTYLFQGAFLHRDSLGVEQRIEPGDVNWMTAGGGIVHSERTPDDLRTTGSTLHAIQTWVALPRAHERVAPTFEHHAGATLPRLSLPGVALCLIAGTAFGLTAPTTTFSPTLYAAVEMASGSTLALPTEHEERAVYPVAGDVTVDGMPVPETTLAVLHAGREAIIRANSAARLMLLGGAPMDGERHIWWNFVASEPGLIDAAKQRWRHDGFGQIPGETEFIPLPD